MTTAPIISEATLAGFFDFSGIANAGNLVEFPDPNAPLGDLVNSRLIKCDQAVNIRFDWTVSGMFAHTMNPNSLWKIQLFLEQYGPGEFSFTPGAGEKTLTYGSGVVSGGGINAAMTYPGVAGSTTVSIPANTIPEGIYDVVAAIRYLHPDGTPCFLAAFVEFGKIDFYQEH